LSPDFWRQFTVTDTAGDPSRVRIVPAGGKVMPSYAFCRVELPLISVNSSKCPETNENKTQHGSTLTTLRRISVAQ
jgi:hypothetical protein